jgi:hypothetical protein
MDAFPPYCKPLAFLPPVSGYFYLRFRISASPAGARMLFVSNPWDLFQCPAVLMAAGFVRHDWACKHDKLPPEHLSPAAGGFFDFNGIIRADE